MSPIVPIRVLFRCDGALPQDSLGTQLWAKREQIRTIGPTANLTLKLHEFAGSVISRIQPRSADLIRIASYVYRADQMIVRSGDEDASGEHWKRHLALCIPVADPTFWNSTEMKLGLGSALQFLTDDVWEFAFSQAPGEEWRIPLEIEQAELHGDPTVAVMFSGGADSLCALLEAAAQGERPVAVGHWPARPHQYRQTTLLASVRERFRTWGFPLLGLTMHGSGVEARENTQRTRGFLFASLGAAAAAEMGVSRVILGDNGPISLNLPINGQVVGAVASRSTHPRFLDRFNRLIAAVFDGPVTVSNPLLNRTRAEVLEILVRTRCEELLPDTRSCTNWRGLPTATPHCGGCSQCVDRRFATVAMGLEAHDPASRYRRDVFLDDLVDWEERMIAESYVRFAQHVNDLSADDILAEYGQIFDAVLESDSDPDATVHSIIELVKRHVSTTLAALKTMTTRHLPDLLEWRLPESCLLRIAIAGQPPVLMPKTYSVDLDGPGDIAPQSSDPKLPEAVETSASLTCDGEMCELTFDGVRKSVTQSRGLVRLAVLLRRPNREFSAEEILAEIEKTDRPSMSGTQAALEGLSDERLFEPDLILDSDSDAFIGEHVAGLRIEIDLARAQGNSARVAELNKTIKSINRELRKAKRLGYRSRAFTNNPSRGDESVDRSIQRAILVILDRHPRLGEHFEEAYVHRSGRFSYEPKQDPHWVVPDLPQ